MRCGWLIDKLSGVVVRDFHSTLLMPAEGNGDFNVIFHAREALRKRNRGEAEISKVSCVLEFFSKISKGIFPVVDAYNFAG